MKIRLASEGDIPTLGELYAVMFNQIEQKSSHTPSSKEKYVARKLGLKDYWIFVAENEGNVIGTISLRRRAKNIGYVCDAVVFPKFRLQGTMRELEVKLQEHAKRQGMNTLILNVKTSNELGLSTWKSLEYKTYEIFMEKKI